VSSARPTFAGWYPDLETGGTKYWDGSRWTGDTRPRRRPFAAPANYGWSPHYFTLSFGGGFGAMCLGGASEEKDPAGWFVAGIVSLLVGLVVSIYYLRGQGPPTAAVEARLAEQRKAADAAATAAAKLRRRSEPFFGVNFEAPDVVGAAQVNAVSNPKTAESLQNLQSLLYTHAITDEEYQAAKDRLLGPSTASADVFGHIAKLVELHRDGILSDVEFAAAKSKALDL
jgi:hypothetical protein